MTFLCLWNSNLWHFSQSILFLFITSINLLVLYTDPKLVTFLKAKKSHTGDEQPRSKDDRQEEKLKSTVIRQANKQSSGETCINALMFYVGSLKPHLYTPCHRGRHLLHHLCLWLTFYSKLTFHVYIVKFLEPLIVGFTLMFPGRPWDNSVKFHNTVHFYTLW